MKQPLMSMERLTEALKSSLACMKCTAGSMKPHNRVFVTLFYGNAQSIHHKIRFKKPDS